MQVAKVGLAKAPGFVLDYDGLYGPPYTYNNYTFAADRTYYVTGPATLSGTTTLESAVIKFPPYNGYNPCQIKITGSDGKINCITAPYRPCFFTANTDQTVGEYVASGTPSGYYAANALNFEYPYGAVQSTLHNIRIRHAWNGIYYASGTGHVLKHSQLIGCYTAIDSGSSITLRLQNVLVSSYRAFGGSSLTVRGENLTLNGYTLGTASFWFTNSLLTFVQSYPYNGVNNYAVPSGTYQTLGAGSFYLANNSTYRNVGTIEIDPDLLAELRKRTTYPPEVLNSDFTSLTIQEPTPIADVDNPSVVNDVDAGYHYDTLHYAWSERTLTSTLLLTNGVAIAHYGTRGTTLGNNAFFISEGSPMQHNIIVPYMAVQDLASAWGALGSPTSVFNIAGSQPSPRPKIFLRFTDISFPADLVAKRHLFENANAYTCESISLRDCEFTGVYLNTPILPSSPAASLTTIALANNLFRRVNFSFRRDTTTPVEAYLYNNLFINSTLGLLRTNTGGNQWVIQDNLFDTVTLTVGTAPLTKTYNGYLNTAGYNQNNNDKQITVRDYQTWPLLGTNYYPGSGSGLYALINAGSRTAAAAGLFHHTTTTDQTRDQGQVDIGYHFIALANGEPPDADLDSKPDYLEDSNGNGLSDPGEDSWSNPVIAFSADPMSYTIGATAQIIDGAAVASDVDSVNLNGGRLSVAFSQNGQVTDVLSILPQGSGSSRVELSDANVTYGGVAIGTWTGGEEGEPFIIRFNSSALPNMVEPLLRSLSFHNNQSQPFQVPRTVRAMLTDGKTGVSAATTKVIHVGCSQSSDIMLVIDVSYSLNNSDFETAKNIAATFISLLNPSRGDRVGIATIHESTDLISPLTTDLSGARKTMEGLTRIGGTKLAPAINLAKTELLRDRAASKKVMVLLTDGDVVPDSDANGNYRQQAIDGATAAKQAGIRIIAVGVVPAPGNGTYDGDLLQQIASAGNYHAPDQTPNPPPVEAQLRNALSSAATSLCRSGNWPPLVDANAAPNNVLPLIRAGVPFNVDASVTDDGLPVGGTLTEFWSVVSAPLDSEVAFNPASRADTQITLSDPGLYTLRLSANDGELTGKDELAVPVFSTSTDNQPPLVDAGEPQQLILNGASTVIANLNGVAFDDGLPSGTLSVTWSVVSPTTPPQPVITSPNNLTTTVSFSAPGKYVFQLRAFDGVLEAVDTVEIVVCWSDCAMDAVLLVDFSTSMQPDPLRRAKDGAKAFVDAVDSPLHQVGFVGFGWDARVGMVLTNGMSAAKHAIESMNDTGLHPRASTITNGLELAVREVLSSRHRSFAKPVIILFGDGEYFWDTAIGLAASIRAQGVRLITVRFPAVDETEEEAEFNAYLMRGMATSDKDFYDLTSLVRIEDIYRSIAMSMCLGQNERPTLDLGYDLSIAAGTQITIQSVHSDDGFPGTTPLTFNWTLVRKPEGSLFTIGPGNVDYLTATFIDPGTYIFRLTASDGQLEATDEIVVTVNDAPNPGAGQIRCVPLSQPTLWLGDIFSPDDLVDPDQTLDGVGQYMWTQVSGPAAVSFNFPHSQSATATFSGTGTYALRLYFDDSLNNVIGDLRVYVFDDSVPPQQPRAGADQTVSLNGQSSVTTQLKAEVSRPCELSSYTYIWTQTAGPEAATINNSSTANPNVTFTQAGTYEFELQLTHSTPPITGSDRILVHVVPGVIDAGINQIIRFGDGTELLGTARDGLGSEIPVTWTQASGPPAGATISDTGASRTPVLFKTPGLYVFQLAAGNDTDQVTVTVNNPPLVQASVHVPQIPGGGNWLEIYGIFDRVFLEAMITDDFLPDGEELQYHWTQLSGPGIVRFANDQAAFTSAIFSESGMYVLQLDVNDGHLTGTGTVTVKIGLPPVAHEDYFTITAGRPSYLLDVLSNDFDPEGEDIVITAILNSGGAECQIIEGKQIRYTPLPRANFGSIKYEISDVGGKVAGGEVLIFIVHPNQTPLAQNDRFVVLPGHTTELAVLANDWNLNEYPEIDDLMAPLFLTGHSAPALGTAVLEYSTGSSGAQAAKLKYTAPTDPGGATQDTFTYTVKDAFGASSSATVFISFTDDPAVEILAEGPSPVVANQTVSFSAQITGGTSPNVLWSTEPPNDPSVSSPTWSGAIAEFSFANPGTDPKTYTLRAYWTANWGIYDDIHVTVLPSPSRPPLAEMFNVRNDEKGLEPIPVVREGLLGLRGVADDPDTADQAGVEYRIMLYRPAMGYNPRVAIANLTPNSAANGFVNKQVTGTQDNDLLGTLDFSNIENGVYELELTVGAGGQETTIVRRFALNSELKIGNLSFSETDYSVAAGSLPVTLTRTYNSLNPVDVGFGPGWTYSIVDMDVQLNETRETAEDEAGEPFSMRSGGGRDITLTLPDGRRVTFVFGFRVEPYYVYAEWYAPPGVHAELVTTVDNRINLLTSALSSEFEYYWEAGGLRTPVESFDFPAFNLTTEDGTVYMLERELLNFHGYTLIDETFVRPYGPPRLTRIVRPNGESLAITKEAIRPDTAISEIRLDQYDSSNVKTRSLVIEKSTSGKITGIRDPQGFDAAGQPTGPLVVAYDYYLGTEPELDLGLNDPRVGNLKAVRRLVDRTANQGEGSYERTTYTYGKLVNGEVKFPSHVTDIKDSRGISRAISHFDAQGRLEKIVDGTRETVISHVAGKQEIINDSAAGTKTEHHYDNRGNVTLTQVYDANNVLKQKIERTFYDDGKLAIESTGGVQTEYAYDFYGNVTKVTVPDYDPTTFRNTIDRSYNRFGQVLTETDVRGKTTGYEYDPGGNMLFSTDALGNTTSYEYVNDRLTMQTDALGNQTVYTYYDGDPATFADGRRGDLKSVEIKERRINATTGEPEYVTLSTTTYKYDANGNRRFETTYRTLPNNQVQELTTEYEYDAQNRVTKTWNPLGQWTETRYNNIGKVESTTDKYGNVTRYFYDARGNLVQTEYPADTRPETLTPVTITRTVYDANNRPIYVQDRREKPASGEPSTAPGTQTEYDALGRVVLTKRLEALTISVTLDPNNNIATATLENKIDTGPLIATKIIEYDFLGRVRQRLDAEDNYTSSLYSGTRLYSTQDPAGETTYTYDGNGNQVTVTRLDHVMGYFYDALNRRVRTTNQSRINPSFNTISSEEYDALGRKVAQTDPDGVTTRYGYDALGRLTAVTNRYLPAPAANPFVTRYTYDEMGNLRTQIDANNHTTTFEYDELGRRTKRILPEVAWNGAPIFETFTYDPPGGPDGRPLNEQTHTDFNGQQTRMAHDSLGRLRKKVPDAIFATVPVTFDYWPTGERKQMTDVSGTTEYQYDVTRRLSQKKWTERTDATRTFTINYTSDRNGNVISARTVHDGTHIGYEWDGVSRLERVTNYVAEPDLIASYQYWGNDRTLQYPGNVLTVAHDFDDLDRLEQVTTTGTAGELARFTYTVADSGVRKSAVETGPAITPRNISYAYDGLYRATRETISGEANPLNGSISYAHDNVGNRNSRIVPEATLAVKVPPITDYAYNANDQLSPYSENYYTYDLNGNTVNSGPEGEIIDSYDFENRLRERMTPTTLITITYDGDGNRIKKQVSDATTVMTTYYVVDDRSPTGYPQVLEELTRNGSSWTVERSYTYGDKLLIQHRPSANQWRYYGYDGHGSVRYLTDTTGAITDTYTYDAFGVLLSSTGTTPNNYLYAGEQFDFDLKLYYVRARYYNPQTGRFWTADTHEGDQNDPLSLHKYLYTHADPINGTDPSGHENLTTLQKVTILAVSINLYFAQHHISQRQYGAALVDIVGAGFGIYGLFGTLLPPAASLASAGASAATAASEAVIVSKGISAIIAGTDLAFAMAELARQEHHLMTDKNEVSTAPDGTGPYTPKFRELLEGTDIDFKDAINKVFVHGHRGPHPAANQLTYDTLADAVKGIPRSTKEYTQAIQETLKKLAKEAATPGTPLNRMLTGQ